MIKNNFQWVQQISYECIIETKEAKQDIKKSLMTKFIISNDCYSCWAHYLEPDQSHWLYFGRRKGICLGGLHLGGWLISSVLSYFFHTSELQPRNCLNSFSTILHSDIFEVICCPPFPCLALQVLQRWPPPVLRSCSHWPVSSLQLAAWSAGGVLSIGRTPCALLGYRTVTS